MEQTIKTCLFVISVTSSELADVSDTVYDVVCVLGLLLSWIVVFYINVLRPFMRS